MSHLQWYRRERQQGSIEACVKSLPANEVGEKSEPTAKMGRRVAQIFVLEDEELIGTMLQDWLDEMGHQAVLESTIEAALQAVSGSGFDAAIIDLHIGVDRSDAVILELERRGIPFALSTGES